LNRSWIPLSPPKATSFREANEPYNTASQIDLSQIDFDALRAHFERAHKHTEAEKLEKFQRLIDEYNADSANVEIFFDKLLVLTQELNKEEQRTIAEHLSEEELAVFDLLARPHIKLSEKEKDTVKKVARHLLVTLKREKLVLD
jgi:type I restriction enzyme, R subunit